MRVCKLRKLFDPWIRTIIKMRELLWWDVWYLQSIIFSFVESFVIIFVRFAFVCVLIYIGRAHTTSNTFIMPNCVFFFSFFFGECVCWWFLYGRSISVSRSSLSVYFYWLTYSCTAFVLVFFHTLEDNFSVKKLNVSHSTGNRNYSSFIVVKVNGMNMRNGILTKKCNSNGTDERSYFRLWFNPWKYRI